MHAVGHACRGRAGGCWAIAVVLLAGFAGAADAAPPVAPVTTRPRCDIGPRPDPFTEDEWDRLAAVADHTDVTDDGLPILVEHLEQFRSQDAVEVTLADLLARPEAYRGRPVRLVLRFARTTEIRPAKPKPFDTLYNNLCYAEASGPEPASCPVFVLTTYKPSEHYSHEKWEVNGYFYRIERVRQRGPGGPIDVPVIVARRIDELTPARAWYDNRAAAVAAALAALTVAWLLVRRRRSARVAAAVKGPTR